MLALLIAVPLVPVFILLGIGASKVHFLSKVASAVLNSLPNFMVAWYFGFDETMNSIVYGNGKVMSEHTNKVTANNMGQVQIKYIKHWDSANTDKKVRSETPQ